MINQFKNEDINKKLCQLYTEYTDSFLDVWKNAFSESPPPRINEFGIIDEARYDTDHGILFIGRETNGWDDEDYEAGVLFRTWMKDITLHGTTANPHVKQHPTMWYNIGRWAMLLHHPELNIREIAEQKQAALSEIGTIAFTNINKARGFSFSGDEYRQLASSAIVYEVLQKEIEILKPETIVCCGTYYEFCTHIRDYKKIAIDMPHPAARKNKQAMLEKLKCSKSL